MKLFIDDVRMPSDVGFKNEDWTIARSYDEAMALIKEHKPQRIAFDHDLGEAHYNGDYSDAKTGFDVAKAIVELDEDHPDEGYFTESFTYSCHSMNPAGKLNIMGILRGYKHWKYGVWE